LRFGAREVHLDKHKILTRVILELGLRENLFVELPAPAAPVRACKIEEQKFVGRRRLLPRLLVIVEPGRPGVSEGRKEEKTRHSGEKNRAMFFHTAIFDWIAPERKKGTTHRRCANNLTGSGDSPAHKRRAINGFKDLAQMFRDELGHLEHTDLALTVEYGPERVIRVDHGSFLFILATVLLDVVPKLFRKLGTW
jgi:hypothetical protein